MDRKDRENREPSETGYCPYALGFDLVRQRESLVFVAEANHPASTMS